MLASSERIDFTSPVPVGAIVDVFAKVAKVGLWSEDLMTGERRMTASGSFVMVAVDADNRPVPVIPTDFDGTTS